jgi:TatA/E family protein of Tat protein translocase
MSFFGMGSMEILVIMVIALIIFGPGKLPEIGAQVGRAVRDFRRATRDLTAEFQESIDDVQATMGEMRASVDEMKRETEALASTIPTTIDAGVKQPLAQTTQSVSSSQHPATTSVASSVARQSQDDVPIAEAPAPIVATKADPLADLIEIQEELGPETRNGSGS